MIRNIISISRYICGIIRNISCIISYFVRLDKDL